MPLTTFDPRPLWLVLPLMLGMASHVHAQHEASLPTTSVTDSMQTRSAPAATAPVAARRYVSSAPVQTAPTRPVHAVPAGPYSSYPEPYHGPTHPPAYHDPHYALPVQHYPAGVTRRFSCHSEHYGLARCAAPPGPVRLVAQLSRAPCAEGRDWGVGSDGIWVDNGCRAIFEPY